MGGIIIILTKWMGKPMYKLLFRAGGASERLVVWQIAMSNLSEWCMLC